MVQLSETNGGGEVQNAPAFFGVLRALRHRNFLLFFFGHGISLIGTWIQSVALSWLVYRLTGSALLLGLVAFVGQIPILPLAPWTGVLADRWPLRRVLVITQTLAMVQAFILAAATYSGAIQIWQILVLSATMGVINAFDMPSRQAFVIEMVEQPGDLSNAIALNSFLVNGARLIGPALAGMIIAEVGEATCFLLNAISYVGVIAALMLMRLTRTTPKSATSLMRGLRDGLTYAVGFAPIRTVLILVAITSLMGMSYMTLMPIFAADILGGGSHTLGFLLSASGLGALAAAFYLASRKSVIGLGRVIAFGTSLFGCTLIAVAWSRNLWLSMILMAFLGMGMMLQIASCNTVLQSIVEEDKRGRIMSLFTIAFLGMTPIGSLLAGGMARGFGAPLALTLGGVCCVIGAVWFAFQLPKLRATVRAAYVRSGLLISVDEKTS